MIANRKLGRVEQAMEILNRCAKTWNVVTISRIKGPLNEKMVRQSLDIIQQRHPRLNSLIVGSPNHLRFQTEGTPKIALRVVKHNCHWQEVAREELNEQIDTSIGLLRAVLVNISSEDYVSYLITTAHHAVSDALSCVRLHSEILVYCDQIASGELINSVDSLRALPPIEELLPKWTKGFRGRISGVLLFFRLGFYKIWHRSQTLGFEKYAPIIKRSCGLVHRQLEPELTQQLVNCCRQENTTVQSALCAALMLTVARKIAPCKRKDVRMTCLSYFDLRKRLEPAIADEHMGVFASSIMGFHTVYANTSFWELARDVKQHLEAVTKHSDIFKMILVAKELIEFCLAFPNEVPATVSVSNIGKVNIPKVYGSFELEEISYAGSNSLYAGVFATNVSTFQGKMLLNFVFSQPSISQETMETLVNNVVSCIIEVCDLKVNLQLLEVSGDG